MSVGSFLGNELDSLVARIRGSWSVEHNDDDTHGHVHADSVATGRLTLSDIAEVAINQAQVDNYAPGGLETAALLRISGTGSGGTNPSIAITGIQIPRDEKGTVLDGRILVLENVSDRTYVALSHEDTQSAPYSRFALPFNTPVTELSAVTQVLIPPKGLLMLIYDAKVSRWIAHSQSSDHIVASASSAGSDNDLYVAGFVSCGTLLIAKTAAGQTISGFESSNIPANARRRITNAGLFSFDILHANTASQVRNRVYCPGQVRYRLHPRESADLYRQTEGGWRLVVSGKADQWVDMAYAAGTFTTDTGTWTVESGDQTTLCYHLDGNKLTVSFDLRTTSVATNPTQLRIALPSGKIVARTMQNRILASDAGTEINTAYAEVQPGETFIRLYKNLASAAWSAATNTTRVTGQITFMVRDDAAAIAEPHTDVAHGDTVHSDADHSDVAHQDVAHGDSHADSAHSDIAHSDVAHTDSHSDTAHSDVAHTDVAHVDSHTDAAHSDHSDHVDHTDVGHADVNAHGDAAHGDTHADTAFTDVGHSDVAHTDSHSDVAHSDSVHVDAGHGDSHSDTVPHSDVTHVDVAHSDTAHADAIHQDVGMHYDTAHTDI